MADHHPDSSPTSANWTNWSQSDFEAYASQYGETGTPVYANGRLVNVTNPSTDLNQNSRTFSRLRNNQTVNNTPINPPAANANSTNPGNPHGQGNPNSNPQTGNANPESNSRPNTPRSENEEISPVERLANERESLIRLREEVENRERTSNLFRAQVQNELGVELQRAKDQFEPNIMSQFDSSTYNLKLHLVNPLSNGGPLGAVQNGISIIVAESGVTTQFQIEDTRINQHVVNVKGRIETMGSEVFMTIVEPYGFTFTERLVNACKMMGIPNHLTAHYVLEIEFTGRDPATSAPAEALIGMKWRMPCIIAGMQMKIDNSSRYDLVLYEMGDSATSNTAAILKQDITLKVSTLGDFFDKLAVKLNELETSQVNPAKDGQGINVPNQYVFNLEDRYKAFTFSALNPTFAHSNPVELKSLDDQDQVSVTISNGTSIVDMVKVVFLATTEYQNRLGVANADATEPNNVAEVSQGRITELKQLVRVDTETDAIAWDDKRNDWAKKFTYKPYEHVAVNTSASADDYVPARTSVANARSKLAQVFRHRLMKKRYDHRFTGVNTEVLNADINLNNLYYVATDFYAGVNSQATNYRVNEEFNRFQNDFTVHNGNTQAAQVPGLMGEARPGSAEPPANRGAIKHKYMEEFDVRSTAQELFVNKTFVPDTIPKDALLGPLSTPTGAPNTMGQIHYNYMTGDMLNLNLSIKGDPYWLGQTRLSRRDTKPGSQTNNQEERYADYQAGANVLLFTMRTPESYDDATGQTRNMIHADTISGLFAVYGVEHIFSSGMYTQTLMTYMEDTVSFGLMRSVLATDGNLQENVRNARDTAQNAIDVNNRLEARNNGANIGF